MLPLPTPPQRFQAELAALGLASLLALLELLLLWAAPEPLQGGPLLTALVLPLLLGLAAALIWRLASLLVRLLGAGLRARLLVGALLAAPPLIHVSRRLFQGTGISTRWYAPYGPYLVFPVLLLFTLLVILIAARLLPAARLSRARRLLLGLALLGLAVLLGLADRRLYPNQYEYLHALLALIGVLALLGLVWLALPHGAWGRGAWLAPLLLLLALPAGLLAATGALRTQKEMQVLAERTHLSGRLAALLRDLLDHDGDHHSVIFGERDCDNRNPAVHPFAPEVPGNGIDEDCDGSDAPPPPPPRRQPAPGVEDYRAQLPRWRSEPQVAALLRRSAGHNIVLIVLDSLRADQVLPTAENRENHPRLLRLLEQSRSFVRAFSAGAGTDIGMATIFTGQLDAFEPRHRSLFQVYLEAGFRTHGIFQREVERWVGRQFSMTGLDTRKVVVNDPGRRDVGTHPTSVQVTDEALRFLRERAGQPAAGLEGTPAPRFFLWVHYFDVHEHHQIDPANLPEPFRHRVPAGRARYRSLLRFVDGQLGRLLDGLEESGLAQRTVVALCGDHGEGLDESPRLPGNHGDVLFNPLVHVPMALRVPGAGPREIRTAVSLADLYPTLLELSGIAAPPTYGISLLPYLFGGWRELAGFIRPVVMYEARQRALLVWPFKFLAWQDTGRVELYDLERDWAEENNLADERAELARALARQLAEYPLVTVDRLKRRR